MTHTRPYQIAVLDKALTEARTGIDSVAGYIRILEKQHADVFEERARLGAILYEHERDRVAVENAIKQLGYNPLTRKESAA